MNRIRATVAALGVFLALPVMQVLAAAADTGTNSRVGWFNNQLQSGGYQGNATTSKPPVLTQAVPFRC